VTATIAELAEGLRRRGIGPGDRVAPPAAIRPEWTVCDLAVAGTGAVCVPIYPTRAGAGRVRRTAACGGHRCRADQPGDSGVLSCLRDSVLDADGYLSITGRKKDVIITAGGKNLTPANLENDMRRCR
jgi:long-subunit acyl-CoA synthetase (AMP-forming)